MLWGWLSKQRKFNQLRLELEGRSLSSPANLTNSPQHFYRLESDGLDDNSSIRNSCYCQHRKVRQRRKNRSIFVFFLHCPWISNSLRFLAAWEIIVNSVTLQW